MSDLHPDFLEQMHTMLGDETGSFLLSLEELPALALRLNPRRISAEQDALPFSGDPVPWEKTGRYILPGTRPGLSLAHTVGAFYLQEASAMLPVSVLDPKPGETILDLCAAPGGKSSQIADRMDGRGTLVCNEPDPKRARILSGNLERLGVPNAIVLNEWPERLAEKWVSRFDAILVDAPCSGEGMFRREPESRTEWTPGSPAGCAGRQKKILESAVRMLKPGGRMVYSTCTYNTIENEGSVTALLDAHPELKTEAFTAAGAGDAPEGMVRIFPHRVRGDGQFAALLRKDTDPSFRSGKENRSDRPDAEKLLERFETEFGPTGNEGTPKLYGDLLLLCPDNAPDTEGFRCISRGTALARVRGTRLEPEHAAAMTCPGLHRLEVSTAEAEAYLRGETIPCEERGWLVTAWHGMPLGWGKASDGVLKNRLPKGLRKR